MIFKRASWRTTAAGITSLLASIAMAVNTVITGEMQWEVIAAAASGIGLLFARDNSVTSEKAGAK